MFKSTTSPRVPRAHFRRFSLGATVSSLTVVLGVGIAPAPAAHAQNLVVNGDFSAGAVGFSTDYTFVAANGSVTTVPPDCAVISNPSTAFPNNADGSYGDHTTGLGLMLYGDGASSSSARIWYETLTLAANTTYNVSFWGADANAIVPNNPAVLQFFAGGNQVGSNLSLSQTAGQWLQISGSFNSGTGGNVIVSIHDANTAHDYNDFTIDDISVRSASAASAPEPGSLALIALTTLPTLPLAASRRRQS